MSYTRERDEFISRMSRDGMPLDVITKLLRYSSTLQRLAVAQCNGDWPADNGERKTKVCPACEGLWSPMSFSYGVCPDCRTEQLTRNLFKDPAVPVQWRCPDCKSVIEDYTDAGQPGNYCNTCDHECASVDIEPRWAPVFGGDPRGAVLRLVPAGTSREDIDSGRERGIYVPARER